VSEVKGPSLIVALALSVFATLQPDQAAACSRIWDEAYFKRISDAVVWGTYVPGERRGEGTIKVTWRIKGPKVSQIPVRWNPDYVSDGADCDQWEPNLGLAHGRFFLRKKGDGTYIVDTQTPMQKAKR
jgi:hypothetical protein